MKNIIIAAVLCLGFMSLSAQAQNAVSGSASQANNTANQISAAGSIASGGTVIFPETPSTLATKQSGSTTTRLKNAPDIVAPSMGSGHPCLLTYSAGASIVGVGVTGGVGEPDEACMMVRSDNPKVQQAGWVLYAMRSPEACVAMRSTGVIAASSDCGRTIGRKARAGNRAPTISSRNAAPERVALTVECRRVGNKITPVVSRKVMDEYGQAAVMAACK